MEEMKQPLEQENAAELADQIQEAKLPQEAPAPKAPVMPKKAKKDLGVTIGIICAAAIVCGSIAWSAITFSKTMKQTMNILDQKTETSVEEDSVVDPETGDASQVDTDAIKSHDTYAYTDESLADKYNAEIVATVGDEQLTGAMFQIFYWSSVYNYLNANADYIAYLGPDVTKPLAEQNYGEDTTWEQYFVQTALDMYLQYVALYNDGMANGTELKEEAIENIENLEADFTAQAAESGFDNANDYLKQSYGPGVTVDVYKEYYRLATMAFARAEELQSTVDVSDEEAEAYFDANAEKYEQQGIQKVDKPVVNIRHILIQPEADIDSDPSDDNTEPDTSSDQAWAAAEQSANEIFETWKQNPTEDNFAALATQDSMDSGSAENGGLYESVYPGQMVTEFNDWCFADGRKVGDTGIVKTSYGYHIMYFSGVGEDIYWRFQAKVDAGYEMFDSKLSDVFSQYTLNTNYDNLHIYDIITFQQSMRAQSEEESVTE